MIEQDFNNKQDLDLMNVIRNIVDDVTDGKSNKYSKQQIIKLKKLTFNKSKYDIIVNEWKRLLDHYKNNKNQIVKKLFELSDIM